MREKDSVSNCSQVGNTNIKDYLVVLYDNIIELHQEDMFLKFTIKNIIKTGFVIHINGLFGYVSFRKMPWKYFDSNAWINVAKYLLDKQFYCKIYEIKKYYNVIINASLHRFESFVLEKGRWYEGIVIYFTKYGMFVEIGHSYDWKYGSIIGLIYKTEFENFETCDQKFIEGQTIETCFLGYDHNSKLSFGFKPPPIPTEEEKNSIERFIEEKKVFFCNPSNKLIKNGYLFYINDLEIEDIYIPYTYLHSKYGKKKVTDLIKNKVGESTYKCIITELCRENFKIKIKILWNEVPYGLFKIGELYQVYFLDKSNNFLHFDVGYHFGWKYGEQIYRVKRTKENYADSQVKTVSLLKVYEFTIYGKPIFEKITKQNKWFVTKKADLLLDTIQTVHVKLNEDGLKMFFIDDDLRVNLIIDEYTYQNDTHKAKVFYKYLKNNMIIRCEILNVDYEKFKIFGKFSELI